MLQEEKAIEAINHALRALRKRHLLEEGAHAPAFAAIAKPIAFQGSEWKEKAESLEMELQQCYKAQSRLSEQLVVEVAESRASKGLIQVKEATITDLQNELNQTRDKYLHVTALLEEKTKAVELVVSENQELKAQLEEMTEREKKAVAENKTLIDRWMLQKMKDAERLNEANSIYEDMLEKMKANSIQKLAKQQVDGVLRQSEDGADYYVDAAPIPTALKHKISAHEGGCASVLFEYNSGVLVSGGQDRTIKMWDTNSGSLSRTLFGCLGSVLDLSITHDNGSVIAASSSNNLYVWDVDSGRVHHTLTGHMDKVCAVDVSKISSRYVSSAAYDRTIKVWDLNKGYCSNTIIFHSNCNALCFSMDGQTIYSGHVDGHLRLWDIQSGKLLSEVAAHSHAVTSISASRNDLILTSGRDNIHNLFDTRSLELCGTLRANGNRVASNWSRSCISADNNYVAAGSVDGSVHIWCIAKSKNIVGTLKEHTASVLCCSWSGLGKPLATSDKNGTICLWT